MLHTYTERSLSRLIVAYGSVGGGRGGGASGSLLSLLRIFLLDLTGVFADYC